MNVYRKLIHAQVLEKKTSRLLAEFLLTTGRYLMTLRNNFSLASPQQRKNHASMNDMKA